jgi:adenylylsulfate kinase
MAKTFWFTGLPCSGKTTLTVELQKIVGGQLLDGDVIRGTPISAGADFTLEGRKKHLLRIAFIAKMLNDNGINVLASFVSPIDMVREEIKDIIGPDHFKLVYVEASKEVCIKRDVKGMWAKALKGEIKNWTGLDSPFEIPVSSDLVINTEETTVKECIDTIFQEFFTGEKKEYDLFIGRYQCLPPHAGHTGIMDKVLEEGGNVCVGLRDRTYSDKDPYTLHQRRMAFEEIFAEEIEAGRVVITDIPDIISVDHGRAKGWAVREIIMPDDIQKISATGIRNKL